ncbi:MAG: tetratricopeptide repeat protein [Candidatus Riflebacteria bacterium]|nr:tetratricopeptide repeat protein [Candidatus Riflebacteria bacterium]
MTLRRNTILTALVAVALSATLAMAQGTGISEQVAKALNVAQSGQPDDAIRTLSGLVSKSSGADKDLAETALGSVYRISGRIRDARAKLKGPIDRSAYVPALVELARTYLYSPPFEPKTAIIHLRNALDHNAKDVEALLELAQAYVNDVQHKPAEHTYRSLMTSVAPSDLRAYFGLARLYVAQKRIDKAKPILEETLKMAPRDPQPYFEMGNMVMQNTAEPEFKLKAVSWYERAAELAPSDPKYLGALIYGYFRTGQNLAAGPVISRLEQLAPNSSATHWAKGVDAEFNVDLNRAAQHYKMGAALDAQDANAQYALGVFLCGHLNADFILAGQERDWKYLPFRDADKAVMHLKTALQLNAAFPFAARARALIDEMESLSTDTAVETPETQEMIKRLDQYYQKRARQF